ncbi:LysR family transcriptional regulator [Cereibacter sp. SYSU M97828]|nr:LysR family transcriptional regulator [Cereibacter flavus]
MRFEPAGRWLTEARLPPLNALRAFVVTARHRSFAGAAEELLVSPAAIGQQVRLLEDHLGGILFERLQGRVELTPLGQRLAPGLAEGFARMVETLAHGGASAVARTRLAAPSCFTLKWLLPRIDRLMADLPDVELVGANEDADCAIALGPRRGWEPFLSESVIRVCRPGLQDKTGLVLLHDGQARPGALRLPDGAAVIEAAIAGRGIGLARLRLAEADLAAGRLVALAGPVPLDRSWSLRAEPGSPLLPWLRGQTSLLGTPA